MIEEKLWTMFEISISILDVIFLYYYLNSIKKKVDNLILIITGYSILLIVVIILTICGVGLYKKMFVLLSICIALTNRFYNITFKNALCICFSFIAILLLSEVITISMIMYANGTNSIAMFGENNFLRFIAIIISKILAILVLRLVRRIIFKSAKRLPLFATQIIIFTIISHVFILLTICGNMLNGVSYGEGKPIMITLLTIFTSVALICTMLFLEKYFTLMEKDEEYEKIEKKIMQQYKYFQDKQQTEEIVHNMYHDMKNHLLYISSMIEDGSQISEYIEEIRKEMYCFENFVNTGNGFLDVILNEKMTVARTKGIRFDSKIDFSRGDFISAIDICAIFGNALDNALEAVEKISENRNRFITLKASDVNDFLVIKIENSMSEKLIYNGRNIITTKKSKQNHGIGLQSIKRSVTKYNGEVCITDNEKVFSLKILIPLEG